MHHRKQRAGLTRVQVIVVIAVVCLLLIVALPALLIWRERNRMTQCRANLRILAVAMHTYHDTFLQLPPSAFYKDGRHLGEKGFALRGVAPGHAGTDATDPRCAPYSMFVKLLPYIEHVSVFDQINFKVNEAFAPENYALASRVVPAFACPSFGASPVSTAVDYKPPNGVGKPALTNYKALGATTLACLEDSTAVADYRMNGGTLHPYARYSFNNLKALTQTAILAETKEPKYAAWWDGTTASIAGFHPGAGNVKDDRQPTPPKGKPALNITTSGSQTSFMTNQQFGGQEDMRWGPSSDHWGLVNHANGGTAVGSIANDIDPVVYRALISRRSDDNGDLANILKKPKETSGRGLSPWSSDRTQSSGTSPRRRLGSSPGHPTAHRHYSNCRWAISAIDSPMAIDAVAAGDGALSTWIIRSADSM